MPLSKNFPYPYFQLTPSFDILESSNAANLLFSPKANFLELVDEESRKKAENTLKNNQSNEFELVLKTVNSPYALFNCTIVWEKDEGNLFCIPQDQRIKKLENLVQSHHARLATTNFELLEKKEEVEKAYYQIKKLSVPFISLSEESALIPIYGEVDNSLFSTSAEGLLAAAYNASSDKIFFDFNAVTKVTETGMQLFTELVKQLKLLGNQIFIIGVKPEHSAYLKDYSLGDNILFESNLKEILRKRLFTH